MIASASIQIVNRVCRKWYSHEPNQLNIHIHWCISPRTNTLSYQITLAIRLSRISRTKSTAILCTSNSSQGIAYHLA